jgi:DNA-binding transcriptional MerR regulator
MLPHRKNRVGLYPKDTVRRILKIKRMQKAGMNLKAIKEVLMGRAEEYKKLVEEEGHRISVYISMDDETREALKHMIDKASMIGAKVEWEAKAPDGTTVTIRMV